MELIVTLTLHIYRPNVHVQRPPAVTLNETPEEFHISTGLGQKI